jgi:hypothetical protein
MLRCRADRLAEADVSEKRAASIFYLEEEGLTTVLVLLPEE